MEEIRNYFEKITSMSDSDWLIFSSKLERREFPKKAVLLEVGKTENYLSFVEKGIVRFYIPKEENDITFFFAFQTQFMSGYDSFLTRTASTFQIETLTKTTLWSVSYANLQKIYKESTVGNLIGRNASEQLYINTLKRELSLLNNTAEQRYLKLFEEQPRIFEQIPLKYIASYIGVTPQALSRIRRRIC